MTTPSTTDTIPPTDAELEELPKRDLTIGLLEHVGYDRDVGEGATGELWKSHVRAILEHAREHLPAADELLADADREVIQAIEWGLGDLDQCSEVELRLLLARLVDAGYADRVALTQDGYQGVDGSPTMFRHAELAEIYRVIVAETPRGDRS